VAAVLVAIAFARAPARAADGPPTVVAVLGFHGSRLADEIKRELESSRFEVLSAEIGARRWQDAAREVDGGRLTRGVAVDEDDRTLTVYTRGVGHTGVDVRLVLSVNPADRMARRHACLSAVELLHALSESEADTPLLGEGLRDGMRGPGARAARRSGAPTDVRGSQATPGDTTGPGPGGPTARATGGAPQPASVSATASGTGSTPPSGASPSTAPLSAVDLGMGTRDSGWQLGAGATFGVETNGGGPTSHLQFMGRLQATPHLALSARVLWPLLATQGRSNDADVRAWSFGVGFSPQYTFAPRRRLRPYLGLGPGARLGITETASMGPSQSQFFTFSVTLGIEAGVRYALSPLVQVFFELAAARAWLIPPHEASDPAHAAANGESARATVGVLFES
jgi:hypothetical protein